MYAATAMSFSISPTSSNIFTLNPQFRPSFSPISISIPKTLRLTLRSAANQKSGPVQKPRTNKKKKKKAGGGGGGGGSSHSRVFTLDDFVIEKVGDVFSGEEGFEEEGTEEIERYEPLGLPKPPAGFVVDDQGRVLKVSNKRTTTIVDSTSNLPLECVIRRVFRSSKGQECMLLCPVDMPVQILKSKNVEGWSDVSADELQGVLPTAAYALAKIHMHLVHSGFCYTARGGFCYSEEEIFEFRTGDGQDAEPEEGIEVTCFHLDGSHYMIYTPSDPLLFVAVKDQNGQLQMAEDELLDDYDILSAIDEEIEFNALVDEEEELLDSLLGRV